MRDQEKGSWVFIADGRLLTNAALTVDDNPALLINLFRHFAQPIEIVDETTGLAASSPFASLASSGLWPLLAQLLLVVALLFAHRGVAFGARRDPPQRTRRAFAEHVTALGLQYGRARAYRYVLAHYGTWAIERLRGGQRPGDPAQPAALLAARTGRPTAEIVALIDAVQAARADREGKAQPCDLPALVELARLWQSIGGRR